MKSLLNVSNWLQKHIKPPSAFSWETLILLSAFSFYMSFLSTSIVDDLLNNLAWIFLTVGVFWATTPQPALRLNYKDSANPGYPLSPWITATIVSTYIYTRTGNFRAALISWPLISAAIATLPIVMGEGWTFKMPEPDKRQNLVLLWTTQLLLSCWLQFYFVVQDWLVQYPTLLADKFQGSAFVVKRDRAVTALPRGALILSGMEPKLVELFDDRPWSEVERLLLPAEREARINQIVQQSIQQISPVEEDGLWLITHNVSARGSGYNLELRAIWQGPRSNLQPTYAITRSCQIDRVESRASAATNPTNARAAAPSAQISNFECEPLTGWGMDSPANAQEPFTE